MKVRQLFALTALALAGTAVLADEAPGAPLTRAEVVQSVLAARAAGTLMPAGGSNYAPGYPKAGDPTTSGLTRAQEEAQVLQARADGTLLAAGDADPGYPKASDTRSTLARSQVKAEVLQARANGELVATGEAAEYGREPVTHASNPFASFGHRLASISVK